MVEWNGKQVVIVGAARQGSALARYLVRRGAEVTITDQRSEAQLEEVLASLAGLPIRWVVGGHPLELLDHCDWVCPSGGVPLDQPFIAEAIRRGIPLSNDSQIFLEAAPCKTIGITGSSGKTTTTTLVGRMAQAAAEAAGKDLKGNHLRPARVFVGGNIGTPLISAVDEMSANDLAILELSSFQLEIMTRSPHVAAITNITPNHLDRHGSMEAYIAAKAHILADQQANDAAVLNREDATTWGLAGQTRGRLFTFGLTDTMPGAFTGSTFLRGEALWLRDGQAETELFPRSAIRLRGEHNLMNVLAACAICAAAGLPLEAMRAGVEGFTGVAHRLEFVRHWRGADWYNDSIATAPERAMAAIRSFTEPLVMLIGGRDKHLPWDEFAALAQERVDHLILFGEMAPLVERELHRARSKAGVIAPRYTIRLCANLREAVHAAAEIVSAGDVVLLSPGGTSFDEFRDFEARGEAFRKCVLELT